MNTNLIDFTNGMITYYLTDLCFHYQVLMTINDKGILT